MSVGRGTTPKIRYLLEQDISEFPVVWLTLQDKRGHEVNIDKSRMSFSQTEEGNLITASLTQEETLSFSEGEIEVQIRAKDALGDAYKTDISKTTADRILKDGEI